MNESDPMADPNPFEAVDTYINSLFVDRDPVQEGVLTRARAAGLPDIHVSPGQGKLLYLLAKMISARRILELGTLAGYSAVWLARAMGPEGRLTSIEIDPRHAAFARETLSSAGLAERCEVIEAAALDVLPGLKEAFDLIFIDANKESYPAYLTHAVRLTRPGGLIVADNVVRKGSVLDPPRMDAQAIGAASFNQALASHPRLEAIILQQVGLKGHDGLAIARVKDA